MGRLFVNVSVAFAITLHFTLCTLHLSAAPTANEDFVVAEDAKTYTNAVNAANDYTDAAIAALPPSEPPGNYAAVSNAAMNALSRSEAKAGFTRWIILRDGVDVTAQVEQPLWDDEMDGGKWDCAPSTLPAERDGVAVPWHGSSMYDIALSWEAGEFDDIEYTATRTRLPTMADLNGKASTNAVAAVRSVADAASATNAAQTAAIAGKLSRDGDTSGGAITFCMDPDIPDLDSFQFGNLDGSLGLSMNCGRFYFFVDDDAFAQGLTPNVAFYVGVRTRFFDSGDMLIHHNAQRPWDTEDGKWVSMSNVIETAYGAAARASASMSGQSVTNYVNERISRLPVAPDYAAVTNIVEDLAQGGEYSWMRPGDWYVKSVTDVEVMDDVVIQGERVDDIGRVYSNTVYTTVYGMAAQCTAEPLDESSMAVPAVAHWDALTAGADIDQTGHVVANSSGIYRVSATTTNGAVRYAEVAISAERSVVQSNVLTYVADTAPARAAVQSAALAQLLAAHNAVTNEYNTRQYVVWDTFTPRIVPTGTGMGQFKHFAVSPHVTASATHYPTHPYGVLTFNDGNGNTATVRETQYVNLRSWATSHGWTDAEAVHVQDIALYVCSDSAAIPDGCIPWFVGEVALNEQFNGSLAGLAGWAAVQSHVQPVPLVLSSAYGKWWNIDNPSGAWRSIADAITAMGPRYPVHVGDSGRPIFFLSGDRPVVVAHFTSAGGCSANYIKGLPILKAFVESVGDTLKTL